ncbi:hypothetical protein HZC09_00790 [Candidatus Micrarchaeota archaeon]|nr:hypothetical protein [Candidatus Micrarchaeota archaeon]
MGLLDTKKGKVHWALISRGKKVMSTEEIGRVIHGFGFNSRAIKLMLVRSGALVPLLFRHQYYVRDLKEMALSSGPDPLLLAASSCTGRFGPCWYFGLQTALKLNLGFSQTQTGAFVVASEPVRSSRRSLAGLWFSFHRLQSTSMSAGVVEKGGLRFSGLTRTVLDFLHFGVKKGDVAYAKEVLDDVLGGDRRKEFLRDYPELLKVYSTRSSISRIIGQVLQGRS